MTLSKSFSVQAALALSTIVGVGVCALTVVSAKAAEKPQYTIEEIMKQAHKGDDALVKKVANGTASADEIKKMLAYYKALALNDPPKGDAASWKTKTAALVAVTEKLASGDKSAVADFKKASNCKACHQEFRPEKKKN